MKNLFIQMNIVSDHIEAFTHGLEGEAAVSLVSEPDAILTQAGAYIKEDVELLFLDKMLEVYFVGVVDVLEVQRSLACFKQSQTGLDLLAR